MTKLTDDLWRYVQVRPKENYACSKMPSHLELPMTTIKPTFWKLSNVIWAVFIGAFCLCPLALQSPTASSSLAGLGTFVGLAVLCWLMLRPIRLEITETQVRAKEGWSRAPLGKKEAFRSEIRSIHYAPKRFSFLGADGQPLMETSGIWTLPDMVKAAEVLRVPLYDDRVGQSKATGSNRARLVYDPGSGLSAGT